MDGKLPQRRSFAVSHNRNIALLAELMLLLAGGMLAAVLHAKLRIPLNMPGHHGLEFMAIYTLIRLASKLRYAALMATIGTGVALLIPGIGSTDPLHSFSYLLPGIVLDLLYPLINKSTFRWLMVMLLAGFAYASIPLSRLLVNLLIGYPYMAFIKYGTLYTTLSFFFFGMMGGLTGFGMEKARSLFSK